LALIWIYEWIGAFNFYNNGVYCRFSLVKEAIAWFGMEIAQVIISFK
jgi:hypothetical protein